MDNAVEEKQEDAQEVEVDLKPKKPAKLAPQGIRTFTVCRLSISDFATVHIKPHPGNESIITYEDGEQVHYKDDGSILSKPAPSPEEEAKE